MCCFWKNTCSLRTSNHSLYNLTLSKLNYIDFFCLRWWIDSGLTKHNHLHTSHTHKRVSKYPQVHTKAQALPSLGGKRLLVIKSDWLINKDALFHFTGSMKTCYHQNGDLKSTLVLCTWHLTDQLWNTLRTLVCRSKRPRCCLPKERGEFGPLLWFFFKESDI